MTTTFMARGGSGGGLAGAVRSEWTKFWSVRSTWWGLLTAFAVQLGYSALLAFSLNAQHKSGDSEVFELAAPAVSTDAVFYLTQLAVLSVATLTIASEYATGSIRSTLQWVPARWRVLPAKCGVLMPVLFVLGIVLSGLSIVVAQALLGDFAPDLSFAAVARTMLGTGAYLALLGVLVTGVGAALRSVAGTISVVFTVLMILPLLMAGMGLTAVVDYLPGVAGVNLMSADGQPNLMTGSPSPYGGGIALAIVSGWALLAWLAGDRVLRGRDA